MENKLSIGYIRVGHKIKRKKSWENNCDIRNEGIISLTVPKYIKILIVHKYKDTKVEIRGFAKEETVTMSIKKLSSIHYYEVNAL
jgi:hypothetical protein